MAARAPVRDGYVRPVDFKNGCVELGHGGGGRSTAQLVEELFLRAFDNEWLRPLEDQARIALPQGRVVVATDSHVVSPLFFPGGDIGSLAVHGTVNDVAMCGARALYLCAGFIIEEGFPLADLRRIVDSMARASRDASNQYWCFFASFFFSNIFALSFAFSFIFCFLFIILAVFLFLTTESI